MYLRVWLRRTTESILSDEACEVASGGWWIDQSVACIDGAQLSSEVGRGMSDVQKRNRSISTSSMATQIAQELRRRIIGGTYVAGVKLRQEQIADELGVSRSPLREALRQLEAEGLVVITDQKGATVASIDLADASELFEMRLLLEPHLLNLAVPRMGQDTFEQLDRLILEMETRPLSDWADLNLEFHLLLYRPANRPATIAVIERIHQRIGQYLRLQITVTDGRELAKREHAEIIDACRQGQSERAKMLLTLHIHNAAQNLAK